MPTANIDLDNRNVKFYEDQIGALGIRQSQVFTELLCFPTGATASELAREMHDIGFFRSPDRNNVHPRLNEMMDMGLVEVVGKRQCSVTNRTVSVYQATYGAMTYVEDIVQ